MPDKRPASRLNTKLNVPHIHLKRVETILELCEQETGDQVVATKDITSLPSDQRVVLRIEFASGLRMKLASEVNNSGQDNSNHMIEAITTVNFPRVLFRGDGWRAIEWIEGADVSQQELSRHNVNLAARMLAAIHQAKIAPPDEIAEVVLNEVGQKLEARLPVLVSHEIISEAQARQVSELYGSISASELNITLIHGDFSPANLVVKGAQLYSVDNDKMRFHVVDYDLCRAVTFWDEWNLSGKLLLEAYSKESGCRFDPKSLFFWGTFDLIYRISHRISSLGEFNKFCITRIRQILRTGSF